MTRTRLLWASAAVALLLGLAHIVAGTPMFAGPLMADTDLPSTVAWLAYLSWHVVSVLLLGSALALAHAARRPGNVSVAVFASALCAAVSLLAFGAGLFGDPVLLTLPAPWGFGLVAILGFGGTLLK